MNYDKLAATLVLTALLGGPAWADDCPALAMIASVDLKQEEGNREILVPVTIADRPMTLLLDTGGYATDLSPKAADALGLTRRHSGIGQVDVAGKSSDYMVHAPMKLGRLEWESFYFLVAPTGITFPDGLDGTLSPLTMLNFDVDIDMGAHKLNLMSQDHCDGRVVYWKADAVAVVPVTLQENGHILVPVELDGKRMLALLDTGAYNSVVYQQTATEVFHLVPGAAETQKTGELRSGVPIYAHTFQTLSLEGISVSHPQVEIFPDLTRGVAASNAMPELNTRIVKQRKDETGVGMILGMDILRHFHMYIAYREHKLYISPAAPATPAATAPASPPTP